MADSIPMHAVVALLVNLENRGLRRGQVGTIVEQVAPDVYEVEFSDDDGRTYAMLPVQGEQLMVLHYQPAAAG